LSHRPRKKHGPVESPMYLIWEFLVEKHLSTFMMKREAN
jgi:hypothetical protein